MHHERMKFAIEIIRTIPENKIDLYYWQDRADSGYVSEPDAVTCGTICCVAGWLALDQRMRAEGMRASHLSGGPIFNGAFGYGALAEFFEIPRHEASALFSSRRKGETLKYGDVSDKEVWLRRVEWYTSNPQEFNYAALFLMGGADAS
jgi:hypothetical protein